MSQWIGGHADGRFSLCKGEGNGERLSSAAAETQSLTFILSPSQKERREQRTILLLQK
jgi:hypothetical protein